MRRGPILIVDDDLDIREILAETLVDQGYDVITAANGRDALALVRRLPTPPSVILLDLMMPVLDGYGFLEERSKDPKLAAIPIAVVTASHGADVARLGKSAPIVSKPINLPQLFMLLHDLRAEAASQA